MAKSLRKILALTLICNLSLLFAIPTEESKSESVVRMVYVCTKSTAAYAYHTNKNCRHIKRCWEENHIEKMSVSEAKAMNRTLCKTCVKHTSSGLN